MVNTVGQRLIYSNAVDLLEKAGLTKEDTVLTQSYLRLEQAMVANGSTQITFPIIAPQASGTTNNQFNTENRLVMQDSFVVSECGIFIFAPSSGTASTSPLLSYPSPTILTTANAAANANTIYHSQLQLIVAKQQILPSWPVWNNYCSNQTQATAATNSPIDQLSGRDDVFFPIEPNWILIGSKSMTLTLNMPNSFAAIQANSRIVVFFRGVLAQNSTSVQ